MNINESIRVQTLIRYLTDSPSPVGDKVSWVEAQDAAATLAEKSRKVLSAGMTGDDVMEANFLRRM